MDEARTAKLKQAAGLDGNGDGDGSVQVHLETEMDAGKAKVFAIYGKGGIGKSRPRRTCRWRFRSWASGSCRSAAIPSTIPPSP
jgi:hypothetical protein